MLEVEADADFARIVLGPHMRASSGLGLGEHLAFQRSSNGLLQGHFPTHACRVKIAVTNSCLYGYVHGMLMFIVMFMFI